MKTYQTVLVAIVCAVFLLFGALATWTWLTIPEAPDPDSLPSRFLAPPAAEFAEAVEEGRGIVRTLVSEEKLPGLSIAVALDGEIVWAEGFRWAEMETETPVTPLTLFRIGGCSTALSSAAVGLLVERGRLDLDAPVQRYLPDFPEKAWPISTRQLMAHAAGIPPFRGEGGIFRGRCADDAERLALFAGDPLLSPPGTELHYSTYGWALVAALISAAAGEPYLDFLRRELLAPLGMERTMPETRESLAAESAHFYYPRLMLDPRYGLQDAPAVDLSCHLAAVGFLSTPSDLVRLGSASMTDELLDPATWAELQRPFRLESGEFSNQALGWTVASVPMGSDGAPTRIVGHGFGEAVRRMTLGVETTGGQVAGGTSTLLLVPGHRLAIAVTSNVSGAENVSTIAVRLADAFVRDLERP